jgi:signal transduction histidine kinase
MARSHLFQRYVVYFIAVVSATLLVTGGTELVLSYREHRVSVARTLEDKAGDTAAAIRDYFDELVTYARHHARWVNWPFHPGGLQVTRLEYMLLLRQVPSITDVRLLGADGREKLLVSRIALDRMDQGADFSGLAAFRAAMERGQHFGPVYFRNETEPYMTVALSAGSGEEATVALAEVNLRFISDAVGDVHVGRQGYAYLVDPAGHLVAHPDPGLVLARTRMDVVPQVRQALAERGGEGRPPAFAPGFDLMGTPVLSARAPVAPTGWWVFVEQPEAEALAPVYASARRSGLFLLLGLGVALVAGLALAGRMMRPVRALHQGANAIGAGDLGHRIDLRTGDELESLAEAFNRMAALVESSHRDLERKVEERTRALEVANRHKSEFLASMSHELRTPLNAVIGFSEVLEMRVFGELNDKQAEYVADIHASGHHLLSLIDDVLDLSKVEAGCMELELSELDVVRTMQETLALVTDNAARRGVAVELDVPPDLPRVRADERRFKQILLNLLSNAVKFTPEGGRVRLAARCAGEGLEVACADTGVGIAAEELDGIFDPFRQVRHGGGSKEPGTGLGLAITRRFVELHGGRIGVRSAPGQGTTFVFNLPRR